MRYSAGTPSAYTFVNNASGTVNIQLKTLASYRYIGCRDFTVTGTTLT